MRKLTSATPSNSALSKARSSLLDGCFCQGFSGGGQRRGRLPAVDGLRQFREQRQCRKLQPESAVQRHAVCLTAKAARLNSINYDDRNADNANPWTAQNVLDFSMPMTSPPGIISRPPASSKTSIRPTRWIFPTFWPAKGERVQRHRV